MCFSATASFTVAGVLLAGGAFCIHSALSGDRRYLAMAAMPVAVGLQQIAEGLVWIGAGRGDLALMDSAALVFMFFVWMFWPSWTAFMTARLEPREDRRLLLMKMAGAGLAFGFLLFLPYLWKPEWLHAEIVHHAILYETTILPDFIVPRWMSCLLYLSFIGFPPLLSSHAAVRLFGWSLIVFVPVTYILFFYAYISILCFFAAVMTANLIFIIAGNKCPAIAEKEREEHA